MLSHLPACRGSDLQRPISSTSRTTTTSHGIQLVSRPSLASSNDDLPAISLQTSLQQDSSPKDSRPVAILIASTVLILVGCGLNFAYGIYQDLYETMSHDPTSPFYGASPAMIDLIGTLSVSLMTIGGPFATAWTKAFSPRSVTMAGGLMFALGNILSSFGTRYWHFVLTQGVMIGLGTCLTYMPAVTVAPGWYDKRRGLAMGVILSGTGVGGMIWAPVLRALNASLGFRNTLRLTGGISWVLITGAALALAWDPVSERRWRAELGNVPRSKSLYRIPLVNWQVARGRKFFVHATGGCLQAAAYYAPVYFFSAYGTSLGYSSTAGANFIAISNAMNALGKIIFGYVADRIGRINTLAATTLLSAVTVLGFWLPSTLIMTDGRGKALYIAFILSYSTFASPYVSLFPASLIELFGAQNFASVNGFFYLLRGLGTLVGTPVAGTLVGRSGDGGTSLPGDYTRCSIFLGTLLSSAAVFVCWARLESVGLGRWKV